MSKFTRLPKHLHDALDASLPPIYPIDLMTGTKNDRINRRLVQVLKTGPVLKSEFCKREGIKIDDLDHAIYSCPALLYEDDGEIGIL